MRSTGPSLSKKAQSHAAGDAVIPASYGGVERGAARGIVMDGAPGVIDRRKLPELPVRVLFLFLSFFLSFSRIAIHVLAVLGRRTSFTGPDPVSPGIDPAEWPQVPRIRAPSTSRALPIAAIKRTMMLAAYTFTATTTGLPSTVTGLPSNSLFGSGRAGDSSVVSFGFVVERGSENQAVVLSLRRSKAFGKFDLCVGDVDRGDTRFGLIDQGKDAFCSDGCAGYVEKSQPVIPEMDQGFVGNPRATEAEVFE